MPARLEPAFHVATVCDMFPISNFHLSCCVYSQAEALRRTSKVKVWCCINKGEVDLSVSCDKNAYMPGENAVILSELVNKSTIDVTLKLALKRHLVLRAQGRTFSKFEDVSH